VSPGHFSKGWSSLTDYPDYYVHPGGTVLGRKKWSMFSFSWNSYMLRYNTQRKEAAE
jgi:hypothetical protein